VIESLIWLVAICGSAAAAEAAALRIVLSVRPASWLVENYRGATVVGRAGASFLMPLAVATGLVALLRPVLQFEPLRLYAAVVATGVFGLLGWLDDTRGSPDVRGMKGHVAHLLKHRRATTGLVKAGAGLAVGVWAAYLLAAPNWAALPAGALIALAANSTNALDARPGRAGKAFLVLAAVILALSLGLALEGPLVVLAALFGSVIAFLGTDLSERVMLGDTGANPLGCALGLAVVALTSWPTWLALAILLLVFCLVADRWSLTRTIESAPVLRWLDELGRPHKPPRREANGN
jgi:UDP-GlcNAc:undecaprenyl-phosphate GlcNAc-1-phosphate transferase